MECFPIHGEKARTTRFIPLLGTDHGRKVACVKGDGSVYYKLKKNVPFTYNDLQFQASSRPGGLIVYQSNTF